MGMFDNYQNIDNSVKPNNRHLFCDRDATDEIVIGGSNTHIFTLFFDYTTTCREANWFQITYKQSLGAPNALERTFDTQSSEVTISVENGITKLTVKITPEISKLFELNKITFAQLKLYMKDDSVVYGDKNYIKIVDTLDMGD